MKRDACKRAVYALTKVDGYQREEQQIARQTSMPVLGTRNGVTFLRLPLSLQRPALPGSACRCPYCAAHPDETPMWDALAVPQSGHSYPVHMPDCRDARE